jgi:NAD(P)-dependent dehydrogenase (short-subunit alcohol dehydrogenase family)
MSRVLVTGATGAIGEGIVRALARQGREVVMVCRDGGKAERVQRDIRRQTPDARLSVELADLSRPQSIGQLAARESQPIAVLINNAAVAPRQRTETAEGIELSLATNVLAYLWLTDALLPHFSSGARVVNVASYWAGDLDLDDLEFERRRYDNDSAYRQSKQANRMLTVAQAERLADRGVTVNACHPGDVPSSLARDLGFGGHMTPDDGARTPVWLATDASVAGVTGRYFEREREVSCPFARDRAAVVALAERCQQYPHP